MPDSASGVWGAALGSRGISCPHKGLDREVSHLDSEPPTVEDRAMPKQSHEVTLFSGTDLASERNTWVPHSAPIFHEVPIAAKS